ncbi:hypothetical protein ACWPKO_29405 (plasmid) [Coraliomargarita sp. W4R53]
MARYREGVDAAAPNDSAHPDADKPGMDAAQRAELDDLRRRAYGPTPQNPLDTEDIARLTLLEEMLRPTPHAAASTLNSHAPDPQNMPAQQETATAEPEIQPEPRQPRAAPRILALVAAGITALLLAGQWIDWSGFTTSAPTPTSEPAEAVVAASALVFPEDPYSEPLLSVSLNGYFGNYIDLPSDQETPAFPAGSAMQWASPLGEYYGWDLWIAGSGPDGEHCILIERDDEVRSRCVAVADKPLGSLRVSLAGRDIPAEETLVMAYDQRVHFAWRENGVIDVVLGSFLSR